MLYLADGNINIITVPNTEVFHAIEMENRALTTAPETSAPTAEEKPIVPEASALGEAATPQA